MSAVLFEADPLGSGARSWDMRSARTFDQRGVFRVGRPYPAVPLAATAPPGETPLWSPLIVEAPEDGSQIAQCVLFIEK